MCYGKIQVRVRLLGPAKDLAGCDEISLTLSKGALIADALSGLIEKIPALKPRLPNYRFAVNSDYADEFTTLNDGDELALIPPVSGGVADEETHTFVGVTAEPIELSNLLNFVASPQAGAIVIFLGTVREESHGKKVTMLTYEAYEPMSTKKLRLVAREMLERWQLCKVAIVHRTGALEIGEIAVAVLVSASHRPDAFAAARYAIERIKEIVPIWKRERFGDGTEEWVAQ